MTQETTQPAVPCRADLGDKLALALLPTTIALTVLVLLERLGDRRQLSASLGG